MCMYIYIHIGRAGGPQHRRLVLPLASPARSRDAIIIIIIVIIIIIIIIFMTITNTIITGYYYYYYY